MADTDAAGSLKPVFRNVWWKFLYIVFRQTGVDPQLSENTAPLFMRLSFRSPLSGFSGGITGGFSFVFLSRHLHLSNCLRM
jgi:hypothetical protein